MKPPKHKTKQDFGNFKSEAEAARAVDAVFHHYGRPDLLNFPDTSLQFLSTRPTAPPGLDEKAKVKFVKEEAKLLLAAIADASAPHSTHTNSLQILEPSASPRRCPSSQFRSFSEISWPLSCIGPDEVDDAVSHPQPRVRLDSICNVSTTAVQTNLEILNSVQNAEQGWGWPEDSSTLAAPPHVANPSAYESQIQSMWLDSLIQSPPAPTYSRSPSPSRFQEEIAYASQHDDVDKGKGPNYQQHF